MNQTPPGTDGVERGLHVLKKSEPYVPGSIPAGDVVVRGGTNYMVVNGGQLVRLDKYRAKQQQKKDRA